MDAEGCSRLDQVTVMVSAAVAATGKFEGLWMPGAAVLAAKERFKCPNMTGSIVATSGHYWCVDVTSICRKARKVINSLTSKPKAF